MTVNADADEASRGVNADAVTHIITACFTQRVGRGHVSRKAMSRMIQWHFREINAHLDVELLDRMMLYDPSRAMENTQSSAPPFVATGVPLSAINGPRCDECGISIRDSVRISNPPQCQNWQFLCGGLPCYGASDSPYYVCEQDDSVELSVCHRIYAHIGLSKCVLPFSLRDTLLTSLSSIKLELPSAIIVRMMNSSTRASLSLCVRCL